MNLRFTPYDPILVPAKERALTAIELLRKLVPVGTLVDCEVFDYPKFVAPDDAVTSVSCNYCRSELSITWWSTAMNDAWDTRHSNLQIKMPCCSRNGSLNDLAYQPEAGFASFQLGAQKVPDFSSELLSALELSLNCKLKVIADW